MERARTFLAARTLDDCMWRAVYGEAGSIWRALAAELACGASAGLLCRLGMLPSAKRWPGAAVLRALR